MKAGDKVSFKDEKLNGVILEILQNGKVLVELEDGFPMEALQNQLVVTVPFIKQQTQNDAKEDISEQNTSTENIPFDLNNNIIDFYAVPSKADRVLTGSVDHFLTNGTPNLLLLIFGKRSKNQHTILYKGELKPNSYVCLSIFKRDALINLDSFYIQILIAADGEYKRPFTKDIAVELPELNQTKNTETGILSSSKKVSLVNLNVADEIQIKDLLEKFDSSQPAKTSDIKKNKKQQPISDSDISKEIDLHINKLTADFQNMTNSEMLALQINTFRKEMDNAIIKDYKQLIFIHGIGDGILRNAIMNETKNYSDIKVFMANQARYGTGALEIRFL
ncbi:MAG TPA: hypothetical protein PLU85_09405 [Bacteroidia bacterium]|jgi:hypothetical protein|nr:Smr/MutS family protein [Bacteroidia bacterium]QQR95202.1 MAG: Smr/MutS family protein [Bacteroidota bacterium]MBP7715532.1 Smr/MutS family protein [Bacteroidia bacterium]HOZ83093.1 hypothetical protein [Bacteroidia bacterium]HOZ89372.1 hypothetical protein [Bacteroidia bacterium]